MKLRNEDLKWRIPDEELEEMIANTRRVMTTSENPKYDISNPMDIVTHLCEGISSLVLSVHNPERFESDVRRIAFYSGVMGYLALQTRSDQECELPPAVTSWYAGRGRESGYHQIERFLRGIGHLPEAQTAS